MDEITRCLEVLGLKPGATEDDVKQAYRELAMVWHPDRFPADSPLQAKADAKLKELNAAYDFLLTHAFQDGQPVFPETPIAETDAATSPTEAGPAARGARGIRVFLILLLVLLAAGAIWWWSQPRPKTSSPPVTISPDNLLPTMRGSGDANVTTNREGTAITGETWLLTRDEYSPPFVIRAVAKTDVTNIRLIYGQGSLIFNWELNPTELHFRDPATGKDFPVPGQGRVAANEWQTIEWRIETNFTTISINGTERARFEGNYAGMAELAGLRTTRGATVTAQQFEVRQENTVAASKPPDLAAGLVLYFPFEADEYGRVSDMSGHGNNGIVHGARFTRDGKVGGAMAFHGNSTVGDNILVPNSPSLVSMQKTGQLTLCAWIKPDSLPYEYPVVLTKGGNYPPHAHGGYEINLHATKDHALFFISGDYGIIGFRGHEHWIYQHLKEWMHLAVVVNKLTGTGKLYVNGERTDDFFLGRSSRDAHFDLANNLYIGAPDPEHHPDRAWFDGSMDELRIYNRALTAQEIRSLPGFNKSNP